MPDAECLSTPAGALQKCNILVVDDTPVNLIVLAEILGTAGYLVRPANSGGLALQSALANPPDLILLDIMMPDMDGYEVCRRLKEDPLTREIPVIFISALGETGDKIRAFEAGGVDYITKPFQAAEVLVRARTHLTIARMQQELERKVEERTEALGRKALDLQAEVEERRRAEQALRQAEARYRTVADFTHDWEYWEGPEGRLLYVSPACESVSGYGVQAFLDDPGLLQRLILPEDLPVWKSHRQEAHTEHKPLEVQFRLRRPDGTVRWVEHVCRPVFDEAGMFLGVRASNRDITVRKDLERELRQAQKLEAIGTLAGGIAHDFNNILAVIFGFTHIAMLEENLSPALKENLSTVLDAAQRAKNLVKQILAFCRKSEQELQPLQVSLIAKETIKLLRSSLPSSIEIRQSIEASDMVLADPTQIHQVIMNLCTNAYHAMREPGGVLKVSLGKVTLPGQEVLPFRDLTPGDYLLLEVRDTGHGMDKSVLEKIFEPFFTTKKEEEGTGLGLAVVHGIVSGCKGAVTAESEPGKGSSFRVYLPVLDLERQGDAVKCEAPPVVRRGTERILVADDEPLLRAFYHTTFEPLGYTVSSFEDGIRAYEAFLAAPKSFSLVITDMTMPGMNGLDFVRNILGLRPDIPIILCTGYSELVNLDQAKAAGVKEYLQKPFGVPELLRSVQRVLDGGK